MSEKTIILLAATACLTIVDIAAIFTLGVWAIIVVCGSAYIGEKLLEKL